MKIVFGFYLFQKYLDESSNAPLELNVRNTYLNSGEAPGYKDNEFKPTVNFPVIFSSISPTIVTHIGNPEKFYFGGINLQHVSEIQFSRNLLLSTEVNARLYDNFQSTLSGPGSNMKHVRTDLVDYLKEDDKDKHEEKIETLSKIPSKINILSGVIILIGFFHYMMGKKVEYGNNFDMLTFILGSNNCKSLM